MSVTPRGALIFSGLAIAALALAPALIGGRMQVVLVGIGVVLVLATIFERIVYKPVDAGRPGPGWQATAECFVDPTTGRKMRVFVKPVTGERRYVEMD
jgi:hypothetical protein